MNKGIYVTRTAQVLAWLGVSTIVLFSQVQSGHPLDIINLPFKVEMRRLDAAAEELKLDPTKVVYLIGFNKTGQPKKTALSRIQKSKNYLVTRHHILPSRIKTIYGGSQDGLIMRISVVQKSGFMPGKREPQSVYHPSRMHGMADVLGMMPKAGRRNSLPGTIRDRRRMRLMNTTARAAG
jgi:hypothetical protein